MQRVSRWRPAKARSTRFLLVGASLAGLAGCAPEAPTEYSQDTNTNFFAGCSDPATDTSLHVELCQCVYRRLELQLPYEKLDVLDNELVADPDFKLQPEFVEIIADCVIVTAGLAS